MPIENVSDTARWVAYYRAMETQRPDAIFKDPYAERLAGERGREIVDTMPKGREFAWPMIVRTKVLDEVIIKAIRSRGADLVVNLAAGLDARPWRMQLPANLRWVDVDLPGILNYKTELLASEKPNCRYEAVTMDLTDRPARQALFAQLGRESERALVVSEGLLIYLPPAQVTELAADLRAVPSFHWWLFDLANPWAIKMMSRNWGKAVQEGNAPFLFAPAEGPDFFTPQHWRAAEVHAMMDDAERLGRTMQMPFIMKAVMQFTTLFMPKSAKEQMRNGSRFVLLEQS